ncbi:MAG TPA: lipopolysaccharide assembly protein LapA domain-containing protein [Cellvibrionaceae bacterium]
MMLRVAVWFKRLFVLVWLLVLVFISAAITADNPQPISLYLLGKAYQASAGFIFMVSLGFGTLLGVVLLLPRLWLLQRKVRKLLKQLNHVRDTPPAI